MFKSISAFLTVKNRSTYYYVQKFDYLCGKIKKSDMATYKITLNERTNSGKALLAYLQALGVMVQKVTPKRKSSYERSQEDIRAGRIEKFASSEEMFESLGI